MMNFLIISTLVTLGYARPELSHLLGSQIPSGSYLPTDGSVLPGSHLLPGLNGLSDLDKKHIYFFSSPEPEEYSTVRVHVAPANRRNTKVIFIKPPSYGGIKPQIIAPPSVTEDKTVVYVLVKRPEQHASITIPNTVIAKPTKPEVYFIKYKNEQEAENVINGGLQEQPVGPKVPDLGNQQLFINTLKDDVSKSSNGFSLNGNSISGSSTGFIGGSNVLNSVSGQNLNGIGISSGTSALDSLIANSLGSNEASFANSASVLSSAGSHGPIGQSGPY